MKQLIILSFAIMAAFSIQAQNEFTVNGHIKGLEDGTVIRLMKNEGQISFRVSQDTVKNERFTLKGEGENAALFFEISCSAKGFPPTSLPVWVKAGTKVKVSGKDKLIYTWDVDSDVPEQIEVNGLIKANEAEWREDQKLGIRIRALYDEKSNADGDERKRLTNVIDSLDELSDMIRKKIDEKEIKIIEKNNVNQIGLERLEWITLRASYLKNELMLKTIEEIYDRLSDEQKKTVSAQNIYITLYPPVTVEDGQEMADGELFDTEGNVHRLSDYKGKFLLLDFWSVGCGPCIMAFPEMKELSEEYKDQLTIISLSMDPEKVWRKGFENHNITWENLTDGKEKRGIVGKYGVSGIPHYAMISPEGIILKSWTGYGKGSLRESVEEYLKK